MREFGNRASAQTLEDLIKIHTKNPPEEMLTGVAQARDIMREFKLSGALGLSKTDSMLLHAYLSDRIMRTRIYDLDWKMHSPEFDFTKKDMEQNDSIRQKLQESLDGLVTRSSEIVTEGYKTRKLRFRARTIELCANDLIARGSILNEDYLTTDVIISDKLVNLWEARWSKEFNKRGGYARQKHLYYIDRK